MKKILFGWFVLAVSVVVLSSGCGGDSSSYSDPVKIEEILEIAEVEKLIGSKVDIPPMFKSRVDENTGFWLSTCNYYAPDINCSIGLMIQPFAHTGSSAEEAYQKYKEEVTKILTDYKMQPVSGIGTKAVWNTQMKQLTIFDNQYMIMVTGGSRDKTVEENIAFSKHLASLLLTKLPEG